mgnify:CR=1 FL=1
MQAVVEEICLKLTFGNSANYYYRKFFVPWSRNSEIVEAIADTILRIEVRRNAWHKHFRR